MILRTIDLSQQRRTHEKGSVTEALNQVYETEASEIEPELIKIQLISVSSA